MKVVLSAVAAVVCSVVLAGSAHAATCSVPPNTVRSDDPGMHLLLRLDEASGVRHDASGSGNGLSPVGNPQSSADHQEGTASLDLVEADSQYLERASATLSPGFPGKSGGATTSLSVGGWVKAMSAGPQPLIVKATEPDQKSWSVWIWNGVIDPNIHELGTDDVGGANDFMGHTPVGVGQWRHFVYTFDGPTGMSRIYVDGVLDAGPYDEGFHAYYAGSAPLRLGYRPGFCPDCAYADVLLDEVFVMDRVLSATEVASIHTNGIAESTECDDGDPCTHDSCEPATGCAHTPSAACGGTGFCSAGSAPLTPSLSLRRPKKTQTNVLAVKAHMTLPNPMNPPLDLARDGITVQLVSGDNRVLYSGVVPGGAAWTANAAKGTWRYRDAAGGVAGIRMVKVKAKAGFANLVLRARGGSWVVAPTDQPLGLQILLGRSPAACGEVRFGPPGKPACRLRASGSVRCQ